MEHLVVGERLEDITADFGAYWKHVVSGDRQLRWLGPEKGVMHLAAAAIINAIWDLYAKEQGKPVWKLLADMSAHELVSCVDFTYLHDAITPEEAVEMLSSGQVKVKVKVKVKSKEPIQDDAADQAQEPESE